ncbi:MAG: NAD(P)/FAD-dependent oxidoreductase [Campylobacterales bacterium]
MKEVVIIGGGYGGAKALKTLIAQGGVRVTLIDRNRFHYRQAELHEFIASTIPLEKVMIDLARFVSRLGQNARFIHGYADRIDEAGGTVKVNGETVAFDALIVATGASTFFPGAIKGIGAHARDIKEFAGAFYYRQRFEELLFMRRGKQSRVVIGGAGLSGVEIAAEMAHHARKLGLGADELAVTLVEPMATVLPGMDPFLIKQSERALKALGVESLHGHFIGEVAADRVTLSDGRELPCDLFIFTGGVSPRRASEHGTLPRGKRGEVTVLPTLQVEGRENIFAVGDVAGVSDAQGHLLPPTSQVAKQSGACAARNIAALFQGRPLLPCPARIKGVMVALGGHNAAGILYGKIKVSGTIGGFFKRLIFWLHAKSFR